MSANGTTDAYIGSLEKEGSGIEAEIPTEIRNITQIKWLLETHFVNNRTEESTYIPTEAIPSHTTTFSNPFSQNSTLINILQVSTEQAKAHGVYEQNLPEYDPYEATVTGFSVPMTSGVEETVQTHLRVYNVLFNGEECHKLNRTSDPLYMCERSGLALVFGVFFVLVGTAAIFGNCLLPIVVWRRKAMRTRQNYIKVSLSFNDMVSGFILLFSVLPNMIWVRSRPENEVVTAMMQATNSPAAIVAGSALIISLQGSLFHLMFLSADRFIAIKWPMWNRFRRKATVVWTLVGVWVLTIVGSVTPVFFPQYFSYLFNWFVFMYTLGYNGDVDLKIHGSLHFALALFFPYVATILLTLLTGVVAFRELKTFQSGRHYSSSMKKNGKKVNYASGRSVTTSSSNSREDSVRSNKIKKPELAVVKTVLIMATTFITAWSLFFAIYFVSYDRDLEDKMAIVYLVSFYSGLSNSVANVIIYSVRDRRFRTAVATIICPRIFELRRPSTDKTNVSSTTK